MKEHITPDQLIPPGDELAHLLLQWSEEADTSLWKIANVTNELVDELDGTVSKQDIYRAVAVRTKGKRPDTIRRWAECARDYSKETQSEYAGLLSFDHFRVARSLEQSGLAPSKEYVLEWAITYKDSRFASVNEIFAHFLPLDKNTHPAYTWWRKARQRAYDMIDQWEGDKKEELYGALKTLDEVFYDTKD